MKISGISSKKLGDASYDGYLDNKNLYNDKELIDEGDLDWYDYGFRNYDPQIGRFPQLDPLTDDYPHYTPYQYAGNEPIGNVDLDGLEPLSSTGVDVVVKTIVKRSAQAASTGATVSKGISIATVATQVAKITTNVINKVSEQSNILKWNASQRWNNFTQGASDKWNDIVDGVQQKAYDEGKPVWQETLEISLGGSFDDPLTWFGGGVPLGRVGRLVNVGAKKYSITQVKNALRKVHEKVGSLPKYKIGKKGSPQRGDATKGYRLDSEGHPNSEKIAEQGPHINYWDYSKGKRKSGKGISDAEPIK